MRNTTKVDFKRGQVIDDGSTGLGRFLDRVLPGNLGERWDNLTQKQRRVYGALAAVAITAIGVNIPFERTVGSAPEHLSDPVPANVFANELAQGQLDAALNSTEGRVGALVLKSLDTAGNKDKVLHEIADQDGKILTNPNAITAGDSYILPGVEVVNRNNAFGLITGQPGGTRIEVKPVVPN